MFTNTREDLQGKTKERSIPDSERLSMAPQPDKFRTPDQAKEPPDHRDSRDGAKKQFENHRDFQSMDWQHPKALLTCADLEWPCLLETPSHGCLGAQGAPQSWTLLPSSVSRCSTDDKDISCVLD